MKSSTTTGARPRASSTSSSTTSHGDTRRVEIERAEQVEHGDLDAVPRFDDGEAVARSPAAGVRRTDHRLALLEVAGDAAAAVRVVAERDHVGARREQPVGELRGDAGAVGDVLAVDDADVGVELLAQRGQAFLDGAPAGDAEDICEEEKSQFRTSVAAGRSSIETWLPASFV